MFCDVVGSAALSEHVDPEDLRDIIGQYRDTCQKVVNQFQGHIAQYLGDGVLTYFGYPQANEDDAIRAVQTGLELIHSIEHLNERLTQDKGISLSIRVGIHTGLVVVGEIGSDDKRSLAMGTTPNVAARLQNLNPAGFSKWHLTQTGTREAAHWPQNFIPSGFSNPHFVQRMGIPPK